MESKVTDSLSLNKEAPSFLLILMGSIGDVVRGLSVAHQLKTSFPACRLTWLVEPSCKTIISLNRYVDRLIVYKRSKNIFLSLCAISELFNELRKEKFDVTLDLQRHFKSGFFSFLSASKIRIGFHPANCKEFNFLFNNNYIQNIPKSESKLTQYLAFISKLSKETVSPLDFGLSQVKERPEQKKVLETLQQPYLCFVMGSSWESKDWPVENYINLSEKILAGTKYNIVLLGDKTQSNVAQKVEDQALQKDRIFNLAAKTSLADVVAVIDNSEFAIGPDSGPGHIAGALGKKYISLFGPTDPVLTAPIGNESLVIKSNLGCMPCYKRKCPGLGKLCMYLITPEMVFQKLRGLAEG